MNNGPYKVYQQQVQYYNETGNNNDPLTNYDKDLTNLIIKWTDYGDQVIVTINANVDISTDKKGTFRHTLKSIGLNELILSRHPNLYPPPTCNPGTKTIDGISGTPAINIEKGEYAQFTGFSDHYLVWIDIR